MLERAEVSHNGFSCSIPREHLKYSSAGILKRKLTQEGFWMLSLCENSISSRSLSTREIIMQFLILRGAASERLGSPFFRNYLEYNAACTCSVTAASRHCSAGAASAGGAGAQPMQPDRGSPGKGMVGKGCQPPRESRELLLGELHLSPGCHRCSLLTRTLAAAHVLTAS